jgi:hypothetical protein
LRPVLLAALLSALLGSASFSVPTDAVVPVPVEAGPMTGEQHQIDVHGFRLFSDVDVMELYTRVV